MKPAFDNYKETENYNLGGVKDQVSPVKHQVRLDIYMVGRAGLEPATGSL
jgi:hypothetical protein